MSSDNPIIPRIILSLGDIVDGTFEYEQADLEKEASPAIRDLMMGLAAFDLELKDSRAENQRMLKEAIEARTLAEDGARMKTEFISIVSHELRTPLAAINGAVKMLAQPPMALNDFQKGRLLDVSVRNCDRLLRLVNDLLDLQKVEMGLMEIVTEEVALMEVLKGVVGIHKEAALAGKIELSLRPDDTGIRIQADEARLEQIMFNLVSNAIKFSPKGQSVQIYLEHDAQYTNIVVEDRAGGISEDFHPRIFQTFTQGNSSDNRQQNGAGLGLCIAKGLAKAMSMELQFESETGVGTRFFVKIPLT